MCGEVCNPNTGNCVVQDTPFNSTSAFGRKQLKLRDPGTPTKRYVLFSGRKGDKTVSPVVTGDPTNVTSYDICIFDNNSGSYSLVFGARVPAGGTCRNGKPCWKRVINSKGEIVRDVFRDPDAAHGGIKKIVFKYGDAGKTQVKIKAKGINVTLTPAGQGGELFNQNPDAVVEIRSSTAGVISSEFQAPAAKNTSTIFIDKE